MFTNKCWVQLLQIKDTGSTINTMNSRNTFKAKPQYVQHCLHIGGGAAQIKALS